MHTCNVPQLPSSLRTHAYTDAYIDTFMYACIVFILDSYCIDTFMYAYVLRLRAGVTSMHLFMKSNINARRKKTQAAVAINTQATSGSNKKYCDSSRRHVHV
jgi:hypothetical protein